MIEIVHADNTEAGKLDIRDDEKRERQGGRKGHHVHPAFRPSSGHTEPRKKRTPESEAEKHNINNLRRVPLIRPVSRSRYFKNIIQ